MVGEGAGPASSRHTAPPRDVLPGSVGLEFVLAATDTVALSLTSVLVWPQGALLMLWFSARAEQPPLAPYPLPTQPEPGARFAPSDQGLTLTVEFSDGRHVQHDGGNPFDRSYRDPARPVLVLQGAALRPDAPGYSGYWLWPLPPPGELRLRCSWPAHQLAGAGSVDGAVLAAAASRARPIW